MYAEKAGQTDTHTDRHTKRYSLEANLFWIVEGQIIATAYVLPVMYLLTHYFQDCVNKLVQKHIVYVLPR